jgi:transposase
MEMKRPFSPADWLKTPKPVRDYVEFLEQKVIQLSEHIERLEAHQKHLEKRLDELESQLNRNSRNSDQPPSTDGPFRKSAPEAVKGREKGHRRQGGQKGHPGHKQKLLAPTKVMALKPEACVCGQKSACGGPARRMEPFYTHQVIEIPDLKMEVTHLVLHKTKCSQCGRTVKAALPPASRFGYGPRLSALIAEMSGSMGASRETVQRFCLSVLGFPISLGAIQRVIDRASEALEPVYNEVARQVRQAPINHVDETSFYHKGRLQWLWTMLNTSWAFYKIHAHRSHQAFLDLIEDWRGTLVSDNYGVYRRWSEKRQSCLAHLIRKAQGLAERKDKRVRLFGHKVLTALKRLCHWAKDPPTLEEELAFYHDFVHLLLDHQDGQDETGKFARSLLREIKSLFLFLDQNGVDPTNNRAERALRFAVLWRKRSNGTQSHKGDRWVERILTLKETCRLHSVSTFNILVKIIASYSKEQKPGLQGLIPISAK